MNTQQVLGNSLTNSDRYLRKKDTKLYFIFLKQKTTRCGFPKPNLKLEDFSRTESKMITAMARLYGSSYKFFIEKRNSIIENFGKPKLL